MEDKVEIRCRINEPFDSLYKLGYFLVDLNSICNFCNKLNIQHIEDAKKEKKYPYGITSRYLNKDSLDVIKLVEFKQGSFLALFVAPVIVGVLLVLFEKYINQKQNQNKIEININNQTIINIIDKTYDPSKSFEQNFDNSVKILSGENKLYENNILYDRNGKKILFNNIERIKGQITDGKW
jgi:hypothetical protein